MKIRHKQSGVVLEGQFCRMGEGNGLYSRTYYLPVGLGPKSQYDTSEWEEVKPEWVDVTAECEADGGVFFHSGKWIGHGSNGYRIRKAEAVMSGYPHPHYFIIEKRQA